MPETMGSLFAREPKLKQRATSPLISIGNTFELELLYHDTPCILMHRRGNGPWQYMVVNNTFRNEAVPRNADVALSAIVSGAEKVVYRIRY